MAPPPLTELEQARLEVLVKPAAWTYHLALATEQQVNIPRAYAVHADLRLVAADILETACLLASKQAAGSSGGVKRIKIDGELEVEKFAATDASSVDASTWCDQAGRLRQEVAQGNRGGLVRSPLAGIRVGSSGEPTFTITRRGEP
ncbi:hypothetical protein [Deinococcus arenicola]|uniref:Uncharacterized protein n=1 Tax=Deinococcus arenicola TaxID=2994950 RepID=A0ABU4DUX9_9DEIO|nr:hypothetical protein [Deinococcus sp. ZS9-10]MDV6376242.1 hypothetical protein [Deinococcus sp. ZS9-10]